MWKVLKRERVNSKSIEQYFREGCLCFRAIKLTSDKEKIPPVYLQKYKNNEVYRNEQEQISELKKMKLWIRQNLNYLKCFSSYDEWSNLKFNDKKIAKRFLYKDKDKQAISPEEDEETCINQEKLYKQNAIEYQNINNEVFTLESDKITIPL